MATPTADMIKKFQGVGLTLENMVDQIYKPVYTHGFSKEELISVYINQVEALFNRVILNINDLEQSNFISGLMLRFTKDLKKALSGEYPSRLYVHHKNALDSLVREMAQEAASSPNGEVSIRLVQQYAYHREKLGIPVKIAYDDSAKADPKPVQVDFTAFYNGTDDARICKQFGCVERPDARRLPRTRRR